MKFTQVNMDALLLMMDRCDTIDDLRIILFEKGYLMDGGKK